LRAFTVEIFNQLRAEVRKALQRIQYGTTHSYKAQSTSIQMPDAVRAVANANGMNRIAIVVPCHRVIGSYGKLTGYGGGLWRKSGCWILKQSINFNISCSMF
jgi:AraC family transcriptional regulator of adaptative response/methylated-DNA-[protein]-cysteine methyltransferase